MNAPVCEISVPASVDASELSGVLACQEFLGAWEEDGLLRLYWNAEGPAIRKRVQDALSRWGVKVSDEEIHIRTIMPQDWNARWAASVQPVRIGRRIGIRPSWARMDLPENGIELIIDPKQAFGTGHHPTTRMILEWLEDVMWVTGIRVLDVGTGSGILAMAALRLGAESALGIDVDATALDCAREYAEINQFKEELELRCCEMEAVPTQPYDVILANLDRKTLLRLCQEFTRMSHSHTRLMVSGILAEDEPEIVGRLEKEKWKTTTIRRSAGWVAIQLEAVSLDSSSSGRDSM